MNKKIIARLELVFREVFHGRLTEMARTVEIDKGQLSRYLAGKNIPSRRVLEKIGGAANIGVGWLEGAGPDDIRREVRPMALTKVAHSRPVLTSPVKSLSEISDSGPTSRYREIQPFFEALPVYWLLIQKPVHELGITEYFALIENCEAQQVTPTDVAKWYVIESGGTLEFRRVAEKDVKDGLLMYGRCRSGQWDE